MQVMIIRGLISPPASCPLNAVGLKTHRGFQEIQEMPTVGCPDGDALYDTLVKQTE